MIDMHNHSNEWHQLIQTIQITQIKDEYRIRPFEDKDKDKEDIMDPALRTKI